MRCHYFIHTDLYNSAFPTYSFRSLAFLSFFLCDFFSALFWTRFHFYVLKTLAQFVFIKTTFKSKINCVTKHMFRERFYVFKIYFICKEKVKHQKSKFEQKILTSMTRALFWNFILEFSILLLALCSYCGDRNKMWAFFKSLVSKSAKTCRLKRTQKIDRIL